MTPNRLIPSPIHPGWLIPEGWEQILGAKIDYRLGNSVLHLLRVQFNQHAKLADRTERHAHQYHQLLYYQRGAGKLEVNRKVYPVTNGSIFFVPAGCLHRFKGETGEAALCFALDFTVDNAAYASIDLGGLPMDSEVAVLLSLLHTDQAKPFQLNGYDQGLLSECVTAIVSESEGREIGYAAMIQSHLLRLIALCLRATRRASGFGRHFRHTAWRHHLIAERVMALIREQAARQPELTLREVAHTCGASPNHLNRILKHQTNRTFHQILLRSRLERAREILRAGKMNCTEAAFESGFQDSNYFSRIFRKTYGYSPSQIGREETIPKP